MAVKFNSVIVTIVLLVSATGDVKGVNVNKNFTFGGCKLGKESCTECYLTLVKSLLGDGDNVLSLLRVFTPPNLNPPEHVIVNYHFDGYDDNATETWFWATSFGYFLYQPAHFQFMSLLFGKPEHLHERRVEVTLPADCYGVKDDFLQFLTHRLKAYVQEQSITARVDDSYAASAINDISFMDATRDYGNDTEYLAINLSVTYPVIILICMLGIIILLMALFVCVRKNRYSGDNKHTRFHKLTRRFRAGIISFAIISFVRLLMMFGMDAAAVRFTHSSTEAETRLLINNRQYDDYLGALYHIPHVVLTLDSLIFVAYFIIVIVALILHFHAKRSNNQDYKQQRNDRIYYTLALTIVCPILSLFIHLPFIAIAYLNDAIYAGSIFIFYTVVTILEFLILEFTLVSCFRLPKPSQMLETTTSKVINIPYCDLLFTKSSLTALVVVLCLSLFYLLVAITVCFFYYLPIVQSLSRSSNQIIVIYQTGLIFLGAGVLYRTVFRKTTPLVKALKRKEIGDMVSKSGMEEWEASNDHQKLADFYTYIITDVIGNLSRASARVLKSDSQTVEPTATSGRTSRNDELTVIEL